MAKKTEMVGFKTTPEVKKALELLASKEDRTMSYIINRAVIAYLEGLNIKIQ